LGRYRRWGYKNAKKGARFRALEARGQFGKKRRVLEVGKCRGKGGRRPLYKGVSTAAKFVAFEPVTGPGTVQMHDELVPTPLLSPKMRQNTEKRNSA